MAVYTEVSDEELASFLAQFHVGPLLSMKGIAEGVENSNFLLRARSGTFILTLYEKRVDPADLPFFLGLLEHLAGHGLPCPKPVAMTCGEALGWLAGRPAALVTFLEGLSVRHPTQDHCAAAGAALADLHEFGKDFPMRRANALSVDGWGPLFANAGEGAETVAQGLTAFIAEEVALLQKAWPHNLPSGIIHADLFPDNVLFLDGKVSGLIDFYFACTDAYAYDLAICLNAWCFEPDGSYNVSKGSRMIGAYQAQRRLDAAEVEALPILARGAALRFALTRLVDWLNVPKGALVQPKHPGEYVDKLRFHQRIRSASELGL